MAPQQPARTAGPHEPDETGATGEPIDAAHPAVDGGGEDRAAERCAERAAALAVTEGFHPLRVRPYVGDPDDTLGDGTGDSAAAALRPPADAADAADGGPATADLGTFATAYAPTPAARDRLRRHPEDDALRAAAAAAEAEHGRHRRRRRGIVVAAAAAAASALAAGAVAVTGSMMGEDQGGAERALPEPASAAPDVTLPANAAPGAVTHPVRVSHHPMRATTTPAPKVRPNPPAKPSVTPSASASATATTTAPPPSATPPQTPPPGSAPTQPPVLQLGASGPEVTDLQQRLTRVWAYRGPLDGRYDEGVEQAVATFQIWYGVQGDPSGVYGPATRAALLAATPPDGPPHHFR